MTEGYSTEGVDNIISEAPTEKESKKKLKLEAKLVSQASTSDAAEAPCNPSRLDVVVLPKLLFPKWKNFMKGPAQNGRILGRDLPKMEEF